MLRGTFCGLPPVAPLLIFYAYRTSKVHGKVRKLGTHLGATALKTWNSSKRSVVLVKRKMDLLKPLLLIFLVVFGPEAGCSTMAGRAEGDFFALRAGVPE